MPLTLMNCRSVVALLLVLGSFATVTLAEDQAKKVDKDQGKTQTLDLGGGVKLELVRIEAGEFMMGSPENEVGRYDAEKQHKVKIEKAFYLGVFEVTQGQYKTITGENPSSFEGDDDLPVEKVTWEDATSFCQKLSKKTGKKIRLPTEAEWEYACRAGTTSPFSTGSTISTAEANYNGRYTYGDGAKGEYRKKTLPVGSLKRPNKWGLHDMHGNVREWCSSKHIDYPYKAGDGREEAGGIESRALRGGSWFKIPAGSRCAYRDSLEPKKTYDDVGLRVVMDVSE